MQNPWNHENYPNNDLKRNTFPCSFQYNGTFKYGYIYPAGIWRTIPGATYEFEPTLGLNFMPTTFPVQTRQRVYVHYFYGRDRNFWSDYKDFINGQRPDLVKPYIDEGVTQARTGSLLDYMGVPTTIVGDFGNLVSNETIDLSFDSNITLQTSFVDDTSYVNDYFTNLLGSLYDGQRASSSTLPNRLYVNKINFSSVSFSKVSLTLNYNNSSLPDYLVSTPTSLSDLSITAPTPYELRSYSSWFAVMKVSSGSIISEFIFPEISTDNELTFEFNFDKNYTYYLVFPHSMSFTVSDGSKKYRNLTLSLLQASFFTGSPEVRDIDSTTSPYWRSDDNRGKSTIKLNAFLPRMYETIYNLYYRNPQNNPYILNGVPEYNKFIPSKSGGVDSNLYKLRRRNWEDDFLTSAVQSPQQGIAPLVGLTDRGATITLTNDDGSVTRYKTTLADDGSLTGIETTESSDPTLTAALIDAVSFGISIEDIRNVNAMQKWLELNLRKGYQYKDIIQARWGISISYNELDLPEFIGGFAKEVEMQAVTQTANINDDITGQLGWQAGRMYASGNGRRFTHYCDEEGYIMCLICVVPVPNYSQLLPKHWFERDLLDSYQPEFNHIGFQPITYKEVCPVQAFQESTSLTDTLEQTFGYQRPWYQYFNYVDEVHGQFRTTLKDYLINRVFDVKPELSESFLLVDPEQINDVFNVTDDDDKIIGAIYHRCNAKLPISLYAQARLE